MKAGWLLLLLAGLFFAAPPSPRAEERPDGLFICPKGDESRCAAWWNRRSNAQQQFLLNLPQQDRNGAMICLFLLGFPQPGEKLRDCAHKSILERRSFAACEAAGHEMLSVPMRDCQTAWKEKHGAAHRP